jgi:hypothetical protein
VHTKRTNWLGEPLDTDRLQLRPTRPRDEEWIVPLFTNPEGRKYLGGALSESTAQERKQIKGLWWGYFAIEYREHTEAIGTLSFSQKKGPWEIAYQLRRVSGDGVLQLKRSK